MDLGTVFEVMRPYDPALIDNNETSALGTYAATLDASKIVIAEGMRPMVFRCRTLTMSQREQVRDQSQEHRQNRLAFRYGVIEIRGIPRPDGDVYETQNLDSTRRSPKDALVPPVMDRLETLGIGDHDLDFIGAAIIGRSFLAHGVPARVRVPDSCLHAFQVLLSLRAAQPREPSTPKEG